MLNLVRILALAAVLLAAVISGSLVGPLATVPAAGPHDALRAWGLLAGVGGLLLGGLALAVHLRRRGPRPVDPQAETLENVEPVEIDTQAVTLGDGRSTTGGHTTAGGSRELPPLRLDEPDQGAVGDGGAAGTGGGVTSPGPRQS